MADSHSDSGRFRATFQFRQKSRDSEFDRLDSLISAAAEENAGYLGRKRWQHRRRVLLGFPIFDGGEFS